jgi:hypothetical protein
VSREAARHELEVEAAGLILATLTGDTFAMDRIVTHVHEDDLDWRSLATEVTYTAACLLTSSESMRLACWQRPATWGSPDFQQRFLAAIAMREPGTFVLWWPAPDVIGCS